MGILSGLVRTRRYRRTSEGYIWQSEDTHASQVFFDDDSTLVDKMTSIETDVSSHKHSASNITAGTFGGTVVAPASTSYTNNQLRNIVFTDIDPEADSPTNYANGSIICVYE